MTALLDMAEKGWIPDAGVRFGIRRLLEVRRIEERQRRDRQPPEAWLSVMRNSPLALVPDKANEQHYEVPPEFFVQTLGPRRKYSSCYWTETTHTLAAAEDKMLELTCQRADLKDGQRILELGCGWGSLTLWMAEKYPAARITAVSNSAPQRLFIEGECARRGFANVTVVTADMNDFEIDERFDRIVSVEMFEHMRNWERLLEKIARWLEDDGAVFVHIFCHRQFAYPFESEGPSNWMGRYFFSGGMMPSEDLLPRVAKGFAVDGHWPVSGMHYAKTAEAWLKNLDQQRASVLPILEKTYGVGQARRWFGRWRLFFLSCAELFAYRGGEEWKVVHYRLRKRVL